MFQFSTVLLVLASMAVAVRALPPGIPPQASQQGLLQLFFNSRITAQDPVTSMACFTDYIVQSNNIGQEYSKDYRQCLWNASRRRREVEEGLIFERNRLVNDSVAVCERLYSCNERNNTLDLFSCHAKVGPINTKGIYDISNNATSYATYLREQYRVIDFNHEQCVLAAERWYVDKSGGNYRNLKDCLDGRVKPRVQTVTTSAPAIAPRTSTSTSTTTTTTTTPPPPTTLPYEGTEEPATESHQGIQQQFAQLLNLLN